MLQLRADNERMQRTIARNGLQDDDVEIQSRSPEGTTNPTASLQKKLSLGDPTTFGLLGCL